MRAVRADARPVALTAAHNAGLARGLAGDAVVLARLVGPLLIYRSQAGGGTALVVDLESVNLRGDWRNRRRSHHVAAGAAWRPTQLGLSLLLAARCDLYAYGARFRRLSRGSAGLAGVAPTQCGRKPEPAPNHVWLCRGTAAHRMGGPVATRLPGCRPRAHCARRVHSTPARRIRRTHGRYLPCTKGCSCSRRGSLAAATDFDRAYGTNLGAAGRWNLGSERRSSPFYPVQDHGMGCFGSHGAL